MKKKKTGVGRLVISKNLIMMLVMLVAIMVTTFSWFTDSRKTALAEGISIKAQYPDEIELAVPERVTVGTGLDAKVVDYFPLSNDRWSTSVSFANSGYLKDLVHDVTSDGVQFAVPNFEAAKNLKEGRKVITDDVWVDGLSSKEALTNDKVNDDDQYDYVALDFYVRSKSPNISVTGGSFLAAGSEIGLDGTNAEGETSKIKDLKGSNIYRRSSYGPAEGNSEAFSADAIVGAMRVSLVGAPVDGVGNTNTANGYKYGTETAYGGAESWYSENNLKFLWVPRPDLFLQTDNNANNWRLTTGIKANDAFSFTTYCHSFYHGDTIGGTTVKKGLTKHVYADSNALEVTEAETDHTYFAVSNGYEASKLGTKGYYPTLGHSVSNVASGAPESSKNITFTAGTDDNDKRDTSGYYVYKFTLNIWIEGEDAEARRSMNNGTFSLNLEFGT